MTESQDQQAELQAELIEVALFPIPNVVAFPGLDLPLHVFEPRYRQLVHDCVQDNRLLGVCHTIKAIHQPTGQKKDLLKPQQATEQTLEKLLNSNQTTYKPQPVFSAGPCEIIETLDDGRLLANVGINLRLELIEERQSLPYRIVLCRELPDTELASTAIDDSLQQKIHEHLIALVEQENEELAEHLREPSWTELEPAEYSFRIFACLRFDADIMQHILETRSAHDRLQSLWQLLGSSTDDR